MLNEKAPSHMLRIHYSGQNHLSTNTKKFLSNIMVQALPGSGLPPPQFLMESILIKMSWVVLVNERITQEGRLRMA